MPMFVVFLVFVGILLPVMTMVLRSSSGSRLVESDMERTIAEMVDRMRDLEDEVLGLQENVDQLQEDLDFTRRLLQPPRETTEDDSRRSV